MFAQTAGRSEFVVYEKGRRIGTASSTLTKTAEGWRVQGSVQTTGSTPIAIPNFDFLYDRSWSGRFMTVDMKSPDEVIVHAAVTGTTTRTDIVRAKEARFRSNSVSPNTIFLPDHAYGAYEAVAARLTAGGTAVDLPIFIAPAGETRAVVENVSTERIQTTEGAISAQHYVLTELRIRLTRVDLWMSGGRLLRLDFPQAGISVVRDDLKL